jgi:hypothetical protein
MKTKSALLRGNERKYRSAINHTRACLHLWRLNTDCVRKYKFFYFTSLFAFTACTNTFAGLNAGML